MVERGKDWCILRTAGPRTLPLSRSLTAAGLDVWTPVQSISKRAGRARERVAQDVPIMPTFVFARAAHLPMLARALALPINPHPAFSIFRWDGRVPLLGDRDIAGLRAAEELERIKVKRLERHAIPAGSPVRVREGVGQGMSGVVEEGDGKFALVAFGGALRVRVATWLLDVGEVQPSAIAA